MVCSHRTSGSSPDTYQAPKLCKWSQIDWPRSVGSTQRRSTSWTVSRQQRLQADCVAVMGDIGRGLYVAEQVIPIYKKMLSSATIITPNHFEIECVARLNSLLTLPRLLADIKIASISTLRQALVSLHEKHDLPHIVISSMALPSAFVAVLDLPPPPSTYTRLLGDSVPARYSKALDSASSEDDTLVCLASTYKGKGQLSTWAFALPTVHGYFAGVGDLFSSLVLAHYEDAQDGLRRAVSQALLAVQGVLLRSHLHSMERDTVTGGSSDLPSDSELDAAEPRRNGNPGRRAKRMRLRELRIIASRSLLSGDEHGWQGGEIRWDDHDLALYRF